jgi:hypothetical protein
MTAPSPPKASLRAIPSWGSRSSPASRRLRGRRTFSHSTITEKIIMATTKQTTLPLVSLDTKLDAVADALKQALPELETAIKDAIKASEHQRHALLQSHPSRCARFRRDRCRTRISR